MNRSDMNTTFRLEPRGLDLRFRRVRLAARTWITPTYVRVRLEGDEIIGFTSLGADDHIRVFFADAADASVDALRAAPSREYTPLAWDAEAGWLDLEFAIHGDDGIAAPWAARAPIGSTAAIGGPRGSKVLIGRPDAWLLAGDETAIPAIRRFVAQMDAAASGRVILEGMHAVPLETPPGMEVSFVHRSSAAPGSALAAHLDALTAGDRPPGAVLGFIAAEQAIVKPGRALLLDRWALAPDQVIVKGYWKRGETEYHAPH